MAKLNAIAKIIKNYDFKSQVLEQFKENIKSGQQENFNSAYHEVLIQNFIELLPSKLWEEISLNYLKISSINLNEINLTKVLELKTSIDEVKTIEQVKNILDEMNNIFQQGIKVYFDTIITNNLDALLNVNFLVKLQTLILSYYLNDIIGLLEIPYMEIKNSDNYLRHTVKELLLEHRIDFDELYQYDEISECFERYLRECSILNNRLFSIKSASITLDDIDFLAERFFHNSLKTNFSKKLTSENSDSLKIDPVISSLRKKMLAAKKDSLDEFIFRNFLLNPNPDFRGRENYSEKQIIRRLIELTIELKINFNPLAIFQLTQVSRECNLLISSYIIFYQDNSSLVTFYNVKNLDKYFVREVLATIKVNRDTISELLNFIDIRPSFINDHSIVVMEQKSKKLPIYINSENFIIGTTKRKDVASEENLTVVVERQTDDYISSPSDDRDDSKIVVTTDKISKNSKFKNFLQDFSNYSKKSYAKYTQKHFKSMANYRNLYFFGFLFISNRIFSQQNLIRTMTDDNIASLDFSATYIIPAFLTLISIGFLGYYISVGFNRRDTEKFFSQYKEIFTVYCEIKYESDIKLELDNIKDDLISIENKIDEIQSFIPDRITYNDVHFKIAPRDESNELLL